jgi:hypothetical protein
MANQIDWRQYAYTVGELREKLKQFPDDTPVIMSSDAEGNSYSPLAGVHAAHYEADSTWSGEIKDTKEDWEQGAFEFGDEAYASYLGDAVPVVLLGPVN